MILVTLATSAFDCQMSMENMRLQMLLCLLDKKERGGAEKLEKKCPTNPFSSASSEAKCG